MGYFILEHFLYQNTLRVSHKIIIYYVSSDRKYKRNNFTQN